MQEECLAFSLHKEINVAIEKVFISGLCCVEQAFQYTVIQP